IAAQYGVNALSIKRGAGEGGVDQLVAHFRCRLIGDRERRELLAMGGQLLGKIGEAEEERPRRRRVDAAGGDGLGFVANGRRSWHEPAVLEASSALRGEGARRAFGAALRIEAVEPVLAVHAPEIRVADGGGVGDQPPLEARPGFRGGQQLSVKLMAPQARVERLWGGEQRFKAFAAAGV